VSGRRWYCYLIACRGGAIYTGIAVDVTARFAQHLAGTGARYTRANPPEQLLARFVCADRSVASRLEAAIKKLPAAAKAQLAGKSAAAVRKMLLAPASPRREGRSSRSPSRRPPRSALAYRER
jgi:putative endonuclease